MQCAAMEGDLVLPALASVGEEAFADCASLGSLTLGPAACDIDQRAFSGCGFSNVVIRGAASLANGTFLNCSRLVDVELSNAVQSGYGVFNGCHGLGLGLLVSHGVLLGFSDHVPSECVIPEGTVRVLNGAFVDSPIISVTLPSTLEDLPDTAFHECGALAVVKVPSSLTTLETRAFASSEFRRLDHVVILDQGQEISVPISWEGSFTKYHDRFSDDLVVSLLMKTGKMGAGGRPMQVWEDYVAGMDPTDPTQVFELLISCTRDGPRLSFRNKPSPDRTVRIYGNQTLDPQGWVEIAEKDVPDYRFFKATIGF